MDGISSVIAYHVHRQTDRKRLGPSGADVMRFL